MVSHLQTVMLLSAETISSNYYTLNIQGFYHSSTFDALILVTSKHRAGKHLKVQTPIQIQARVVERLSLTHQLNLI